MTETKTHTGGCHCGRVRYEVETDLGTVISCNCSICSRKGLVLTFVPGEKFTLISGEDSLTDYQFNKHVIHHLSCATCGVQPFARGRSPEGVETVAINVRCLDDVDVAALSPTPYDGRSL